MTAPLWLTEPCPAWCREQSFPGHRATDHPSDRIHASAIMFTPLLTEPFENFGDPAEPKYEPVQLAADLVQHYREAAPRVALGDTADAFSRYLSLDETEHVAVQLLELVRAGRTGTAVAESPAAGGAAGGPDETAPLQCQPWCASHDDEEALCLADDERVPLGDAPEGTPLRYAHVGLAHTNVDGPLIDIGGPVHIAGLSVDEACGLLGALARQICRALSGHGTS